MNGFILIDACLSIMSDVTSQIPADTIPIRDVKHQNLDDDNTAINIGKQYVLSPPFRIPRQADRNA